MKILKKILFVILALIALVLIAALIAPKNYDSQAEIVINKPQQEVFDYVKYVKNQDNFGVWQLSDPEMKTTAEGTDGTVGFKYNWVSDKLGKGSQTITNIEEFNRMDSELDFGFGGDPAKGFFVLKEISPTQTSVTWGVSGESPYPWNLMNLFINMDGDFKKGLENLKNILEK